MIKGTQPLMEIPKIFPMPGTVLQHLHASAACSWVWSLDATPALASTSKHLLCCCGLWIVLDVRKCCRSCWARTSGKWCLCFSWWWSVWETIKTPRWTSTWDGDDSMEIRSLRFCSAMWKKSIFTCSRIFSQFRKSSNVLKTPCQISFTICSTASRFWFWPLQVQHCQVAMAQNGGYDPPLKLHVCLSDHMLFPKNNAFGFHNMLLIPQNGRFPTRRPAFCGKSQIRVGAMIHGLFPSRYPL